MSTPFNATYRFQFNRDFRFEHAHALVPYLARLGISHVYASPLLKARSGSLHGYDAVDPTCLNPEIGTQDQFDAFIEDLHRHAMGLIVDFAPNHMAATSENPWWMDVLLRGQASRYANFFDINWRVSRRDLRGRVLLPILGKPLGETLEAGELPIAFNTNGFEIAYFEYVLPVAIHTYPMILEPGLDEREAQLGDAATPLRALIERAVDESDEESDPVRDDLWRLYNENVAVKDFINARIAELNGTPGEPHSFDRFEELLAAQYYRLSYWMAASEELNYRRFFDISHLIGMRVENPECFEAMHRFIFRLIAEGKINGLRLDHIDGLADPTEYLCKLQDRLGEIAGAWRDGLPFYVVVEKILSIDERLPQTWPVNGTTGYEFLNSVNGLFVNAGGRHELDQIYHRFTGQPREFEDIVYEMKSLVLERFFSVELRRFSEELLELAVNDRHASDITQKELAGALEQMTICLPVYRTYIRSREVLPRDRDILEWTFREMIRRDPNIPRRTIDFLRRVFLPDPDQDFSGEDESARIHWIKRWQQITGPVMAKGFEDTALYNYFPLLSLNDVGGEPASRGVTAASFHRFNLERLERWPLTMNSTSTHDTKRSEDVRARLNVFSEIPEIWRRQLNRWRRWNEPLKQDVGGRLAPDSNEEILIYQTLLGAWPLQAEEEADLPNRIKEYLLKAAREAKTNTSWTFPNPEYEEALTRFAAEIMQDGEENKFVTALRSLHERIAFYGAINSLAQTLLKITSPGVPDFYQGTEFWDFSLVDPDNRRPVDFEARVNSLHRLEGAEGEQPVSPRDLLLDWKDGRVKQFLIHRALNVRRQHSDLFIRGDYLPISIAGHRSENVCAFVRRHENQWVLVVVPRFPASLSRPGKFPLGRGVWGAAELPLPAEAPQRWKNVFTGATLKRWRGDSPFLVSKVLSGFPVALLTGG